MWKRHQYWYRYLTQIGGFAINPKNRTSKIRNPGLTGCCYQARPESPARLENKRHPDCPFRELERQSASVGFADPGRACSTSKNSSSSRARGITGQTPESALPSRNSCGRPTGRFDAGSPKSPENLRPRRKPRHATLNAHRRTHELLTPEDAVKALQAASALLHAIPGATTSAKIIATTSEH